MLDNLRSRYKNDEYNGFVVRAYPGLHARLATTLTHHTSPPARVLDLGCGSGAWGQRLFDLGYQVEGVDIDPSRQRPFPFRTLDLNKDFAEPIAERYQIVTAIELMEHLENPRHLLRQISEILEPGGTALISTPNASGLYSRVRFFLTGTMTSFTDSAYRTIGHITPVTYWQMTKILGESDLNVVDISFADARFLPPRSAADILKALCWVVMRPFMMGRVGGQSMIVVLRKPAA